MNKYAKKTGLALAVLLASSLFAIAPANAHDSRDGVKTHFSTGGYHDGHSNRYYKHDNRRRHAKRHYSKRHWKHLKKHYRMHREYAHYDRYSRSHKRSGYRDYDRSGYGIKFYYHGS